MIAVTYKGFKIVYDETFRDKWVCTIRLKGPKKLERYIEKDQLKEVKQAINEALDLKVYKSVEVFKFTLSDVFDTWYKDRLKKRKASVEKNLSSESVSKIQVDGYPITDQIFIVNESNQKKIESLIELRGEVSQLKIKASQIYESLERLREGHLEEDTESMNDFIRKAKSQLPKSEAEKTKMTEKLSKEVGKERLLCASALKDAKWNYQLALSKLKAMEKTK